MIEIINIINSSKKKKIFLKKKIIKKNKKFLDLLIKVGYLKYYNISKCLIVLNSNKKIKIIIKKKIKFINLKKIFNLNTNTIYIISTSVGLITHLECLNKKLGGFLICQI